MPRFAPVRFGKILVVVALTTLASAESSAIEMFTYFGDGSRIGLPSLEVPVEAYPGIPLRRDRLRARRRGLPMRPAGGTGVAAGPSRTITIRAMPTAVEAPVEVPPMTSSPPSARRGKPTVIDAADTMPMPPEPEDVPLPASP